MCVGLAITNSEMGRRERKREKKQEQTLAPVYSDTEVLGLGFAQGSRSILDPSAERPRGRKGIVVIA